MDLSSSAAILLPCLNRVIQLAQVAADNVPRHWLEILNEMETGKIVVVSAMCVGAIPLSAYAIGSVIRSYNGMPDDSEELAERISSLEKRVAELEAENASLKV